MTNLISEINELKRQLECLKDKRQHEAFCAIVSGLCTRHYLGQEYLDYVLEISIGIAKKYRETL